MANLQGEEPGARPEPKVKSFEIDKRLIVEAWEKVRANNGAPGVDAVSIGLFAGAAEGQSLQAVEQDELGELLPGAGAGRGDTERSWGRRAFARRADGPGIMPHRPVILRVL